MFNRSQAGRGFDGNDLTKSLTKNDSKTVYLWKAKFPHDVMEEMYSRMKSEGVDTDEIAKTLFTVRGYPASEVEKFARVQG